MRMLQIAKKSDIVYPELSYELNGLFFKVHNTLGRFRNEKQYGDALEQEMKETKIVFEREKELPISFEGEGKRRNIVDFMIDNKIILEIKAKRIIERTDYFQVKRYLVSSQKRLGILVNFQQKYLTPKRVLNADIRGIREHL